MPPPSTPAVLLVNVQPLTVNVPSLKMPPPSKVAELLVKMLLVTVSVTLEPASVRVTDEELSGAFRRAEPGYLKTLRRVRDNIMAFQSGILNRDASMRTRPGCELRLRYRPLRRVGVCIPGGSAAYPSSLLMTVVPALAAGVEEIAVVVPPTPFGGYNDDLLAACHALGVTEVYRIGGAQAVAALAYGVKGIAAVDKIVGPGNLFVALAKKHVYGEVAVKPNSFVITSSTRTRFLQLGSPRIVYRRFNRRSHHKRS